MNDLINLGGGYPTDSILGDASAYLTPEDLNRPLAPQTLTQPVEQGGGMLPKPTVSQAMLKAGLALLVADQEGAGAGAKFLAQQNAQERAERRAARREQLDEFELLGRIRDRQLAEMQATRKLELKDKLKKANPDLADLIDLDPAKAAEVLAKRQSGAGPYEGTSIEAQDTNILLTGDPTSAVYRAAYARQGQAKMIRGEDGQVYTIQPDMSAYAAPGQPRPQATLTAPQTTNPDQTMAQQPSSLPASSTSSAGGSQNLGVPAQVSGAGDVPVRQTNIGGLTITEANLKGNGDSKERFEAGLQRVLEKARSLDEGGGIPQPIESTDDIIMNPLRNIANTEEIDPWGILPGGQDVGRMFNTKNQRNRDQISQEIPKLFLELRKGGGLTGKELDTAAEREFYLQSLFRKGTPLETIIEAVKNNSQDFGTGQLAAQLSAPQNEDDFSDLSEAEIKSLADESGKTVDQVKKELGIK